MEEICKRTLGRWSATVNKVAPGTPDANPDATMLVELRCDGELFGHFDNGRATDREPVAIEDSESESMEEWAERIGLRRLSEGDVRFGEALVVEAQELVRHIEQGGSVEEWDALETERATQTVLGWAEELGMDTQELKQKYKL